MYSRQLSLFALSGIPKIHSGDDLAQIIIDGLVESNLALTDGDIVVLAQKIVSKAEGRFVDLGDVSPSKEALAMATTVDKDPRLVELILQESTEILRARPGVMIVEHRGGTVLANAGIDRSNVGQSENTVLPLPVDPDASAARLRASLQDRTGAAIAILIIDSIGRAWRNGTVGTAIGVSGMPALVDLRARPDLMGQPLQTSELGVADEVAAAASLVMGQADEGTPAVLVRGLPYPLREGGVAELHRPRHLDLFR